jgi:hypothetical protein
MFTYNTRDLLRKAKCHYEITLEGMENVHLRGAMFGYYKSGSDKQQDADDRWPDEGLMLMKPGKLLKKIVEEIGTDVTDLDIENAVNRLKNVISIHGDEHGDNAATPQLVLVKGELIGAYYLESNYAADRGNIGSSCMRHESCLPAFKIYERNQHIISMLVLKSQDNKVIARALLWQIEDDTYMDTVYSIADNYRDMLIDYAKRHNFYWKKDQSCHHNVFDMKGESKATGSLVVSVPISFNPLWQVPYMDTMFNVIDRDGQYVATNLPRISDHDSSIYRLRSTSARAESAWKPSEDYLLHTEVAFSLLHGTFISDAAKRWSDENNGSSISKSICQNVIKGQDEDCSDYRRYFLQEEEEDDHDGEVWSEWHDCYIAEDDAVYSDAYGDYIRWEDSVEIRGVYYHQDDEGITYVESRDRWCHVDDTAYCKYSGETIHIDDAIHVEDYGYVHENDIDEVAVEIDGTYYKKDDCVQCAISGEWMIEGDEQELPDGRLVTQDEYDKFMAENQEEEEEEKP